MTLARGIGMGNVPGFIFAQLGGAAIALIGDRYLLDPEGDGGVYSLP